MTRLIARMKLRLLKYLCSRCACAFDAPALPEGAYGEFLLWSRNGQIAYLNALKDPTFKEVSHLLALSPVVQEAPSIERAAILHRIYGRMACDKDTQGAPFEIDMPPPCPACGGTEPSSWEFKEPVQIVEVDAQPVTHRLWSSLSHSEKEKALRDELNRSGLATY
jgi:hypothetical protein